MDAEGTKAVVRRFVEDLWNARDASVADEIFTADCVAHGIHHQPEVTVEGERGPGHIKPVLASYFEGFPDWHIAINDIASEGDKVWLWSTSWGTHTGPFMGMPPSGRPVTFSVVRIFRIADGKIAEYWHLWDWLGLWQQLGLVPETDQLLAPAQAKE